MNVFGYQTYIWIYLLGTALTFLNGLFWHSPLLHALTLVLLYCILLYRGLHILMRYGKTMGKKAPMDHGEFRKTYGLFRVRVALFWLAFIALCIVGKWGLHLHRVYFYCCTFFFLFLDRWFVNVICLLQKCCDPKGDVVRCCCGCPCRGWDLMMIHTPLLFGLEFQNPLETILILASSAIALLSFISWEHCKYHLIDRRPKCKSPCDLTLCREYKGR